MNLRELKPGRFADWREAINEIIRYLFRVRIVPGDGVTVQETPGGTVVSATAQTGDTSFWARITGYLEDGEDNNRWFYAWQEVVKTTAGFGLETLEDGTRSGTTEVDYALNVRELMNTNEEIQGTGIDLANLPNGFVHKPIPIGAVVRMYANPATGEYLFAATNHVDGSCD